MAEERARSEAPEDEDEEEKVGAGGDGGGGGEATAEKESSALADRGPDAASPAKGGSLEAREGANSAAEAATATATAKGPAGDGRTFSQLLAGAMASPAGSPRAGAGAGTGTGTGPGPILAVPVDAVRLPMVAVPCFLAPASLLESPGFTGQFAMTHQAVLATVTAQAQMQLQASYPSSSSELQQSVVSTVSPVPLQQKSPMIREENVRKAETEQPPSSDQKSQSAHIVVKTSTGDGYNWRKYGQKQVKSSESSRSYYKCTNTNCFAKKKVERCPDGRVVEIIYRGRHNHDPPQKTRCSKERGPLSGGPSGEIENLELPSSEVNESDPSLCKIEQNFGHETPEQQLYCSSDCEGDAGIKTEEDMIEEPDPKRRLSESTTTYSTPVLKTIREPKIVVQTACDVGHVSDGYRWRKYGQKIVKGNPNPRSYYRCTHNGCPVRKHVERASDDAKAIVITYEGKHNHDQPAPKLGMDPSATAHHTTSSTMAVKDAQLNTSNSLLEQKPSAKLLPDVGEELTGEKASELGGEKALESAQALLSIGFNSPSGDDAGKTNSEAVKNPLFNENTAAVPVQNS